MAPVYIEEAIGSGGGGGGGATYVTELPPLSTANPRLLYVLTEDDGEREAWSAWSC